jgi:hypothetical protein
MVQGFVWATHLGLSIGVMMWMVLEIILLLVAVSWDLASLVFALRRNIKGTGPSGVPVISWLVYVLLIELRKQTFFFSSGVQAGVVLTVFHLLCHFGIPWLHKLFVPRKPEGS